MMKRRILFLIILVPILFSCGGGGNNGQLVGVPDRKEWYEADPYGMVFIPMGSFNMGPSDQDVPFAITATTKTVSIDPIWMDVTEITNNEYRQFVYWVRDSIARSLLGEDFPEEFLIAEDKEGNEIDPAFLNWEEEIDWENPEYSEILSDMFLQEDERFFRKKEIDARKLKYKYQWIDLKQAAKKTNRWNPEANNGKGAYSGEIIDAKGKRKAIQSRKDFILEDELYIYPDTLVWMAEFTYAYNEPMTRSYFWHTAFDNYPVVGVTWKQARAFSVWRTQLMNSYLAQRHEPSVQDYRLPTEAEWEYAARGGLALSPFPWGGPYTRNYTGCFIANFKNQRGIYGDDGGNRTLEVAKYSANDYGLFDMAGNVAEWTANAFDESAYQITHDLNPHYEYNAVEDDPPAMKRKVIRGGSWKDIGYYLQVSTRTYEYQDTAKSYIGFRCVRSYMGRDAADWDASNFY
jgi:formylglycine-generating enzyme required for sulfatase activity